MMGYLNFRDASISVVQLHLLNQENFAFFLGKYPWWLCCSSVSRIMSVLQNRFQKTLRITMFTIIVWRSFSRIEVFQEFENILMLSQFVFFSNIIEKISIKKLSTKQVFEKQNLNSLFCKQTERWAPVSLLMRYSFILFLFVSMLAPPAAEVLSRNIFSSSHCSTFFSK